MVKHPYAGYALHNGCIIGMGGIMPYQQREAQPDVDQKLKLFSYQTLERFPEPEPIVDATSDFEQMDRGDGFGVDDVRTYHRTEK
jgi:hypothetical protein